MGELQDLFGQLWKEYSLSDSRYLTQDAFVLCMETITAVFWGPLAFVVVGMIALDHPLRHPLQIIVSLGQLYGDVLYYATSMFDHYIYNRVYCRPEAYYFWGYFVFMNFFWIIIPLGKTSYHCSKVIMLMFAAALLYRSSNAVHGAFRALEKMDATLKKKTSKKSQ